MTTPRGRAAERLVELLRLQLVGDCLDVIGCADARDAVQKALIKLGGIAKDERESVKKLNGGPR